MLLIGWTKTKLHTKNILNSYGIKVLDGIKINHNQYYTNRDEIVKAIEQLNYPVIIKPNTLQEVDRIINECIKPKLEINVSQIKGMIKSELLKIEGFSDLENFKYDEEVLIEKSLLNFREFNCAALGYSEYIIGFSARVVVFGE